MATIHLCFSPSLPTTLSPSSLHPKTQAAALTFTSLSHSSNPKLNGNLKRVQIVAAGGDLLGDFGGRDPFPAEIESRFGEKVLGNVNTEHKILIPNISALSLAQQECEEVFPSQPPISPQDAHQLIRKECEEVFPSQPPISPQDAQQLIRKVVGWRLVDDRGSLRLQCLWKLRDYKSAVELVNRIHQTVEDTRHYPNLHLEPPNQVRAELWTSSIGGLSMNDFIVAAKIDAIKTSDLVPKRRVWA